MTSSSGRLADVGESRCNGLADRKVLALLKDYVSAILSQTPCSARNPTEEIMSCGEKCANLCRVYKLIMVSHVPGYGHLEYLVLGLSCRSHHYLINLMGC